MLFAHKVFMKIFFTVFTVYSMHRESAAFCTFADYVEVVAQTRLDTNEFFNLRWIKYYIKTSRMICITFVP